MAAEDMHDTGQLLKDEPMSRHTSWRVGGTVDTWFRPATLEELAAFLPTLEADEPVYWVGLGSNLLVRDGGVRGVIISVQDALNGVEFLGNGLVKAGAGLACTVFARQCVRRSLGPAEFFAGIPGTIGGALAMNAGAFGGETWEVVDSVETIDRSGTVRTRKPEEYSVTYRQVNGPEGEWFVSGTFSFHENFATSMENMKALVNERKEKQPLGLPSCGSVFRNPENDHAARLIEAAGLKGFELGGAVVSDKHANFIINKGEATAADIEALIEHVQTVVREQHGVELKREVHIIGEALNN